MQYGHFDPQNREYVITKPNTPAPWANYLGSPAYGAIITNNAGGYSFAKSGAKGRITRYRFNENDRPGRYVYLRDQASGDYWSASWQPVGKPVDQYKSECRHGTGYTELKADYSKISSTVKYYVPHGSEYEVWNVTVTNNDSTAREISAYGYAEFTNDGNYEQDQVNLQYSQFITRTYFRDPFIFQYINENFQAFNNYDPKMRFFGLAGAKVESHCGDKAYFLGRYRDYGNPAGIENGKLCGTLNYNMNSCGALQTVLNLAAGESKTFTFILGEKGEGEARDILSRYENAATVTDEINALKKYWHGKLENLQVKTPNEHFDNMLNTWHSYQCFITFIWSRAASLSYCGLRNGYGYRDTVQDIQGIIHLDPEAALEKIKFMLSAQVHHGGGLPLVKFTHNPGHEDKPEDASYRESTGHPSYRADDMLWMYPTIWKYIAETGNIGLLDEVVPYADQGEDTVYNHLKKAIDFTLNHLGIHDLPAGLHADWNDCLRMGAKGVSVFVALQFYYGFEIMSRFATQRNDKATLDEMNGLKERFGKIIEEKCWDTDRFVRGVAENGDVIGAPKDPEANLWLNPQTWAVLSGFAKGERAKSIMDLVYRELNTKYGARLMTPSYEKHAFDGALALLFYPATKENGAIFLQTQGWLILAEALLGRGDRALEYYLESCPSAQSDIADIRLMEPYAYSQFTESTGSPFEGRSHVHWLTGTASTVMVGCVEGILGLRPDINGLQISPSVPADWKEFSMKKSFRGKNMNISVKNPDGKLAGCRKLTLNGKVMDGDYIPADALQAENEVVVEM
ncbi:MAG: N,N'-diacetylchitobiose phosphorylase [Defluviitaleaceae bacterium]|nr:N,N'-diacetylchitobiose phosphorylase [Defluviitaleaceae bacterium]MCL2262965.1 N,N'-diacetylchitobiose phosphorylase [Defluviitaleaceae bacterium]